MVNEQNATKKSEAIPFYIEETTPVLFEAGEKECFHCIDCIKETNWIWSEQLSNFRHAVISLVASRWGLRCVTYHAETIICSVLWTVRCEFTWNETKQILIRRVEDFAAVTSLFYCQPTSLLVFSSYIIRPFFYMALHVSWKDVNSFQLSNMSDKITTRIQLKKTNIISKKNIFRVNSKTN